MPRHPSWDPLYNSIMKEYCTGDSGSTKPKGGPCLKGEDVYYALLNKHGWDDTKPRPSELTVGVTELEEVGVGAESFNWLKDVVFEGPPPGYGFIRVVAINKGQSRNDVVYTEEEIRLMGRTLTGKPLFRGSDHLSEDRRRVGFTVWSEPEDDRVEGLGLVDQDTWNFIKQEGRVPGSIEYEFLGGTQLNGFQVRHVNLTGYLIIDDPKGKTRPGDPGSFVEPLFIEGYNGEVETGGPILLFETHHKNRSPETRGKMDPGREEKMEAERRKGEPKNMLQRLIDHHGPDEALELIRRHGIDNALKTLPERGTGLEDTWKYKKRLNETLKILQETFGETTTFPEDEIFLAKTIIESHIRFGYTLEETIPVLREVVWTTEYINDLPDSAFAYIEPGGRKDDSGRTTPRTLRHLPYKDAKGKIDVPHLRNALARLPQTKIPDAAKNKAKTALCKAARSLDLEFPACQETSGETKKGGIEMDDPKGSQGENVPNKEPDELGDLKMRVENLEKIAEVAETVGAIKKMLEDIKDNDEAKFAVYDKRLEEVEKKLESIGPPMGKGSFAETVPSELAKWQNERRSYVNTLEAGRPTVVG